MPFARASGPGIVPHFVNFSMLGHQIVRSRVLRCCGCSVDQSMKITERPHGGMPAPTDVELDAAEEHVEEELIPEFSSDEGEKDEKPDEEVGPRAHQAPLHHPGAPLAPLEPLNCY